MPPAVTNSLPNHRARGAALLTASSPSLFTKKAREENVTLATVTTRATAQTLLVSLAMHDDASVAMPPLARINETVDKDCGDVPTHEPHKATAMARGTVQLL
jgi:hypothetical protein